MCVCIYNVCVYLFLYLLFVEGKDGKDGILRSRACAVTRAHCCEDCCIVNNIGYEKGKQVVYDCMLARDSMSRQENKNDLRTIINVCHVYQS